MIDKLLADVTKSPNKVLYKKKINNCLEYDIIDIFNGDIDQPLHKYWFYIPNAKISEIKNNNMQITLSASGDDSKLTNYVETLQRKIKDHFKAKKLNNSFKINKTTPSELNFCIDDATLVFDENDNSANTHLLKKGDSISLFVEIKEMMYSRENQKSAVIFEGWITWNIIQIKLLKHIDMRTSLFKLKESPGNTNNLHTQSNKQSFIPPPPPPPLPHQLFQKSQVTYKSPSNIKSDQNNKILNDPINTMDFNSSTIGLSEKKETKSPFAISAQDLQSQLTKLKKVKTDTINEIKNSETNIVPKLKKVSTKEPKDISEWYAESEESELSSNILIFSSRNEYGKEYLEHVQKYVLMVNRNICSLSKLCQDVLNKFF